MHRDHLVVVAVPDHAALRRAGRPRGVDEREEVLLVDRRDRVVERARVRRRDSAALPPRARRRSANVSTSRRRGRRAREPPRPSRAGRRPRRARRPPPSARGRSGRRVASCSRRSRRRPRRRARARSRTAPIRASCARGSRTRRPCATPRASRPFAISSTRSAASAQVTSCQRLALVDEVRGRRRFRGDGVAPEARDRPVAGHPRDCTESFVRRRATRRESSHRGAKPCGPAPRLGGPCASPGTDHSASAS